MSDSEDDSQEGRRLRNERDKYRNYYGSTRVMMIHNQDMLASKRPHFEGDTVDNDDNDNAEERRISTRPDSAEGEAPIYQLHPESDEQIPECDPSGDSLMVSGWDHWKNITLYMIAGYVLGILLVLIWYYRHPRRASQDLTQKWLLIVLFCLLLMILGYSRATRCVVALIFPTLGSHRGRALLMALAFFVAGTGPVMNIIRNVDIMGHSLACGQSSLRQALTPMQDIMGQPINVVERSVEGTIMQVRKIMESLDKVLQHLEEPLVEIHANYKSCAEWLRLQHRSFELQMGKPYERCLGAGAVSLHECQAKFGIQQKECSVKDRFVWFCENLRDMSSFFERSGKLQQEIIEEIFQRLKENFTKIRAIFVVSIGFVKKQTINATNDSAGRDSDVILEHEIDRHLEAQRRTFILFFVCLDLAVFILVFTVVLRSIYFRLLYLGSNDFNNVYLTHSFDSYDRERDPLVGVRVVPLRVSEKNKFVKITSIRLLSEEYQIMAGSILFLVITAVQLFCICFMDYSLYIMLSMMSYHAHKTAGLKPPAYTRIVITKGGMIGDILRSLVHAFEPLSKNLGVGTEKCLPVPGEPNVLRYYEILSLCVLAWLLVIWEPYSLRVRHWVMACFYPEDAQRRVKYLHERILRERSSFIKTARRRARSVHIYSDSQQFACISWCSAVKIWCLSGFPSAFIGKTCIICSKALTASDNVHCDTDNCRGIYCQNCFIESNNYCILCTDPRQYWDDSDLSEVGDSTEDSNGGSGSPDDADVEADEEFSQQRKGHIAAKQ